jgi:hypothetical protein
MFVNVTITSQNIIHRPVFYLKHDVSETGFFLHLKVIPTHMGLSPETGTSSVDREQLSRQHLKTETDSSLRNVVF